MSFLLRCNKRTQRLERQQRITDEWEHLTWKIKVVSDNIWLPMIVEINMMTFSKKKKWMLVLLSEGQSLMICNVCWPLFYIKTMHFIRSVNKLLATNQSWKIKVAHFNLTHTKSEWLGHFLMNISLTFLPKTAVNVHIVKMVMKRLNLSSLNKRFNSYQSHITFTS